MSPTPALKLAGVAEFIATILAAIFICFNGSISRYILSTHEGSTGHAIMAALYLVFCLVFLWFWWPMRRKEANHGVLLAFAAANFAFFLREGYLAL